MIPFCVTRSHAVPPSILELTIDRQPTDTSCGPTCLAAVYRFLGDPVSIDRLLGEIGELGDGGGTLAVMLGGHALRRGHPVVLYSFNLRLFDPTWFGLGRAALADNLRRRAASVREPRLELAARAYADFLELGGELRFVDLSQRLLRRLLDRGLPVLAGLSATWLHRSARECPATNEPEPVTGEPVGHFVVLCGFDERTRRVRLADPLASESGPAGGICDVGVDRLISAILLGVLTWDANLLQIGPVRHRR